MAPRARTPSFTSSRIAAAYSSRNKKAAPIKTHMTVVNWENVLVPMDWMVVHLGLRRSAESISQAFAKCQSSPELQRSLVAIEEGVMTVLQEAMKHGPVFIVSDFTSVYVEYVSSLLFPRLTTALRNATRGIYVLGAPDTELSSVERAQWKSNLLQTVVVERLFAGVDGNDVIKLLKQPSTGRIGVTALCANDADMIATSAVQCMAPNAVLKRVKVKSGVQLRGFLAQLQTMIQFVQQAGASCTPVSLAL